MNRYLTNTITNVERFPIGFKSMFDGRKYYHIVLGLYYNGKFGAIGISRRKDLMDKPIVFRVSNISTKPLTISISFLSISEFD